MINGLFDGVKKEDVCIYKGPEQVERGEGQEFSETLLICVVFRVIIETSIS